MKRILICILLVLCSAFMVCCRENPDNQSDYEGQEYFSFTDSAGNIVTLNKRPEKAAVLFSSYADVWQLSGGSCDITVGESVERGFADNDAVLVDDGAGHTSINLELLISQKPDIIIATTDYDCQVQACETARQNGIPSALFKVESFEDYLYMLDICCKINQSPDVYSEYGQKQQEKINDLLSKIEKADVVPKKVLFIRAGSSARSAKAKNSADNFACKMLSELGAVNIADSAPVLLDGLSLETISYENPDIVLVSSMGDETASREYVNSLFQSEVWSSLDCIKSGNYSFLPKDLFHFKPNEKWYEAYAYLAKLLYPEIEIE